MTASEPVCYLCHCIVWLLWMTASDPFVIFAIVLSDFFEWRLLTQLLSLPLYFLTSLNDGFWPVCYLCHCIVWLLWMTASDNPFVIFAIVLSDFFEWRLLNPFVIFAIVLSDFFEWRLLTRLLSLPLYCLTSLNDGFWTVRPLCLLVISTWLTTQRIPTRPLCLLVISTWLTTQRIPTRPLCLLVISTWLTTQRIPTLRVY